jgi:prophage DNA circulation protein
MSFVERVLRPASLRGVGFWVTAAEDEPRRRWVTHEFPGRDDPWHEDLGRGVQLITVEGLLIGDDVVRQARRFREAAAAPGTARLIHPWYGELAIVVLSARVRLSTAEGRVARIELRAERAGTQPAPRTGLGLIARVLDAVDRATDAVMAELQRLAPLAADAQAIAGLARDSAALIRGALAGAVLGRFAGLGGLGAALSLLADTSDAEATSPALVGARIAAALAGVAAIPGAAGLDALLALAEGDAPSGPAPLAAALPLLAAVSAAEAAAAAPFETREAALAARDRIAEALDAAADEAGGRGWDETWRDLATLRATSAAELTRRAAPLPRLATITLPAPIPASLLAYRIDGDALATVFDRGTAIAARARAPNPLLLPAGRPIEVLT